MNHDARLEPRSLAAGTALLSAKGFGTARVNFLDLSANGAQLSAPLGLREGSAIILIAEASDNAANTRRGVVRWVKADTLGVQFVEATAAT